MIADLGCFTAYPGEFIGERERSLIALVRLCDRPHTLSPVARRVRALVRRVAREASAANTYAPPSAPKPFQMWVHWMSPRIADSSCRKAASFSSAQTTKRFPSSRCASTIQIVRPTKLIGFSVSATIFAP